MMMTPCVTVTGTAFAVLFESVAVIVVFPALSAVTVIVAFGPLTLLFESFTMPPGFIVSLNVPLYPASLIVSLSVGDVVKFNFVGLTVIFAADDCSSPEAPPSGIVTTGAAL